MATVTGTVKNDGLDAMVAGISGLTTLYLVAIEGTTPLADAQVVTFGTTGTDGKIGLSSGDATITIASGVTVDKVILSNVNNATDKQYVEADVGVTFTNGGDLIIQTFTIQAT